MLSIRKPSTATPEAAARLYLAAAEDRRAAGDTDGAATLLRLAGVQIATLGRRGQ